MKLNPTLIVIVVVLAAAGVVGKFGVKRIWHGARAMTASKPAPVAAPSPSPLPVPELAVPAPTPTPEYFLYVWFNSEVQAKATKKQGGDDKYTLLFYYRFKPRVKDDEEPNGIVKCKLNRDWVDGYIAKEAQTELAVHSYLCWELKPE